MFLLTNKNNFLTGSLTGGVTGNRILICSRTECYSWSGSNPTVWNPEIAPPSYSLQTAVTTYQGVWFSGTLEYTF